MVAFQASFDNGHSDYGYTDADFLASFDSPAAWVGAVITAFAVGLPWLILLGVFLWVWLKLIWPRIRRKKKA